MTQQLTKVHKKLDLTNLSDKQTSAEQGINVIKDLKKPNKVWTQFHKRIYQYSENFNKTYFAISLVLSGVPGQVSYREINNHGQITIISLISLICSLARFIETSFFDVNVCH